MEFDNSLSLMEQVLASDEIGRDKQSTSALLLKLDVLDKSHKKDIDSLEQQEEKITLGDISTEDKIFQLLQIHCHTVDELLQARRSRLQDTLSYHQFCNQANALDLWIDDECIPSGGVNSRSLPNLLSNDVTGDTLHTSHELISLIVNVQEELKPDHMIIGHTHQLRIQLSQLRCLEYKMKVAGAILKQVKNAIKQASRRKHPSFKSYDYIDAIRPVSHDIDKLHYHRSSTISQSTNHSELIIIRSSNKSATLPGHYRTYYKLPTSIIKLFALWKSPWCVLLLRRRYLMHCWSSGDILGHYTLDW
ncbi:uncharacterized protein [Dysidea avara]|uniref:uncharacterized protein n=1 Tax=Dysidea avara TaxID=196820 RepID=UPI00331EB210